MQSSFTSFWYSLKGICNLSLAFLADFTQSNSTALMHFIAFFCKLHSAFRLDQNTWSQCSHVFHLTGTVCWRHTYIEGAVSEGRFRHHLFRAVFVRTSYPSRYVYFRWSRVHTAVETAVTATVVMWERCKNRVQLEASEIDEIQAPVAHERRVLSRPDLHQVKDVFLYFLKIITCWDDISIKFGAISPWS